MTEWQGLSIAGADALTQSMTQFAFFVELHDGFYEDIIGSDFDRYVIREKSRCDADFPIQYNPTADEGDYWRSCTRNRDVDYNATLDNALINYDFAAWTCDQSAESCPLVPPPTDITPDGEVPPHGLCDAEVTLPPVDGVWRGMNHHSQFKCIELVTTLPAERDAEAPHQRLASDLTTSNGAEGTYQLNRCSVACPEGDADCTTDCQDGLCATTSEVAEDGSTRPIISCTPIGRSDVQDGEVGFAAMRFVPESNYERGCIDEWSPTQVVEEALPWKSLCPGYATNPSGIRAQANPGDFGKLVCGCGFNYGGPNCDQGCITSNLHYGGGNGEVQGDCSNGYCAVTAEGDGGRLGFWLCGESASTSYSGTEEGLEPKLRADGWVLGGDVSPMGIETTEMCQDSENCASGWSIHK
ncbi:MAG: hypothetical protein AAFX99_27710 [Myxococcota bacterium]